MNTWYMMEQLEHALGTDELLEAILRQMSELERFETASFIARMYDIELEED